MSFYKEFLNFAIQNHPYWSETLLLHPPSENVISPAVVWLRQELFEKIQNFIKLIYKIRNSKAYQETILGKGLLHQNPHYSVFMGFDFHIQNGVPKLIEINTNAAFAAIAQILNEMQAQSTPFNPHYFEDLKKSFWKEMELCLGKPPQHIDIIDEDILSQNAYFEFLMFKDLFNKWGLQSEIYDYTELKYRDGCLYKDERKVEFIYNRFCDFYLKNPKSEQIKAAYNNQTVCLSPHPREYFLLADKNRLIDFRSPELHETLQLNQDERQMLLDYIPDTFSVNSMEPDELWKVRKKYFFKPKTSFGSKATYKGASISRKVFQSILTDQFLAQEAIPPEKTSVPEYGEFKFDIRFFVYAGEIQLLAARLFQGQVTNFRTLGGGIAPVFIKK